MHAGESSVEVGNIEQVENVKKLLMKAEIFGFEAIGLATDADEKDVPVDIPKLGGVHDLETILHKHHIDSILILGSPKDRRMLGGWMRQAEAAWDARLVASVLNQIHAWEHEGRRIDGIQLDFDARTPRLADYAAFLKQVRRDRRLSARQAVRYAGPAIGHIAGDLRRRGAGIWRLDDD